MMKKTTWAIGALKRRGRKGTIAADLAYLADFSEADTAESSSVKSMASEPAKVKAAPPKAKAAPS